MRSKSFSKGRGVRIFLSGLIASKFGVNQESKTYVTVQVSSTTIVLRTSVRDDDTARLVTSGNYVTCNELLDLIDIQEGERFTCNAEVVRGSVKEVWATFPPELRERIAERNGVVS